MVTYIERGSTFFLKVEFSYRNTYTCLFLWSFPRVVNIEVFLVNILPVSLILKRFLASYKVFQKCFLDKEDVSYKCAS